MVSTEIKELCDRIFPSSNSRAKMFTLGASGALPNGELYDRFCVLNMMMLHGAKLVGSIRLIFANGETRESLCSQRIQLNFDATGAVAHIIHENVTVGQGGEWEIEYDHFFDNPKKTEPWLFESKVAFAGSVLGDAFEPKQVREIHDMPPSHPLLNSLDGVVRARMYRGGGNGQRGPA